MLWTCGRRNPNKSDSSHLGFAKGERGRCLKATNVPIVCLQHLLIYPPWPWQKIVLCTIQVCGPGQFSKRCANPSLILHDFPSTESIIIDVFTLFVFQKLCSLISSWGNPLAGRIRWWTHCILYTKPWSSKGCLVISKKWHMIYPKEQTRLE